MNTTKVYFTSDSHFCHTNIIGYCNRPFLSADKMDQYMIQAWNETVRPGDLVYHLGDFMITGYSRKHVDKVDTLLKKLNGNKILIRGNHDAPAVLEAKGWSKVYNITHVNIHDHRFILCHYAMRTWQFKAHGSIHLYGHSHGNLPPIEGDRSMDVGVDAVGYKPISVERIIELMKKVDYNKNAQ